MNRRLFLRLAAGQTLSASNLLRSQSARPNIVLVNCDDLGYGDVGCYGSRIRTPNIDSLAERGVKFRHFYAPSSVCSPSRAALMTGRYPGKVGMTKVLVPEDPAGLPRSETTMADMLTAAGYRTMCAGKWHLGARQPYLPTDRGFNQFLGIPYSSDMSPLPLLQNSSVIEEAARLESLSERLTDASTQFIRDSSDAPFFLYYAPSLPHLPLTCSRRFRAKSKLGSYGDAVQEIDWSIGEIVNALRDSGREENTLLIFTSDNGPWFEGSAGQLRGRKADTWEGGMRVPFVAAMPSRIPAGRVVNGMANAMDLLPTFANLCQAPLPAAPLDGVDIWKMMVNEVDEVEHPVFLYFYSDQLQCGRVGKWKLHIARMSGASWAPAPASGFLNLPLPKPELYDLENDPGESYDCADENPDIVSYIRKHMLEQLTTFPSAIQRAHAETQSRKVAFTPPGAIPMEQH